MITCLDATSFSRVVHCYISAEKKNKEPSNLSDKGSKVTYNVCDARATGSSLVPRLGPRLGRVRVWARDYWQTARRGLGTRLCHSREKMYQAGRPSPASALALPYTRTRSIDCKRRKAGRVAGNVLHASDEKLGERG